MRLSTSTNIYFNRPDGTKSTIEESIKRCSTAGYSLMDFNFYDCSTFRLPFVSANYAHWIDGIIKASSDYGISFNQCHLPFYNFCDENYAHKEEMDMLLLRAIECASMLHIPHAIIHAGTALNTSHVRKLSIQKNIEYFKPVLDFAHKKNVSLVFENLWDYNITPLRRFTTEVEDLLELVEKLDDSNIGICYDTDHAQLMKQNHRENLMLIKNRLVSTHISDCINVDSDHLLPFDGTINWNEIMSVLRDIQYAGDFTYEIHRYTQSLPDELVDSALAHSVHVGNYLISL